VAPPLHLAHESRGDPGRSLREQLRDELGIVYVSSSMEELFDRVTRIASSEVPVLITGESGTGKELVARALHHLSPRGAGPFYAVNLASLSESVVESELFGHVKGSFTGATQDRAGYFVAASQSTLFLDEIAETSLTLQAKLLRAVQE